MCIALRPGSENRDAGLAPLVVGFAVGGRGGLPEQLSTDTQGIGLG